MFLTQRNCIHVLIVVILSCVILYNILSADFNHIIGNSHENIKNAEAPNSPGLQHSEFQYYHYGEDTEAGKLWENVRVLCLIMTYEPNHWKKAVHVKATWAKRCNKFIFMSSVEDKTLGAVALNVSNGRNYLWAKTKEAFKYVYKNHFDEADWFLKADDDTYVILENLRYLLSSYNASDLLYFGPKFKIFGNSKNLYMSGGGGYVLSKAAVAKFVEEGISGPHKCDSGHDGFEDVKIGICLYRIGVSAIDARDHLGRLRFYPLSPEQHLNAKELKSTNQVRWFQDHSYYPVTEKQKLDACSDTAVTFHYVSPNNLYVLEYLIYYLRPFGLQFQPPPFPPPLPPDTKGIPQEVLSRYQNIQPKQQSDEITPG